MGPPIPNVGSGSLTALLRSAPKRVLEKAAKQKLASKPTKVSREPFSPKPIAPKSKAVNKKPGLPKAKTQDQPVEAKSKPATVPWSQIRKHLAPVRREKAPLYQLLKLKDHRDVILQPRWLPLTRRLFPYSYTHRRPNPNRLFYLDTEEQKRTKFFIFDSERPELHKIGHPVPPSSVNPSMVASVEVLTTPTADTPGGSVFLRFDRRSYVFGNASEGTQRVFTSRGVSMGKIEDIFLTGLIDWHGVGGLLGMVLTLADIRTSRLNDRDKKEAERRARERADPKFDASVAKQRRQERAEQLDFLADSHLNIHGGKNLTHMLATARGFIYRNGYPLRPQEIREDPRPEETCDGLHDWEDENIKVWHVPVVAKEGISTDERGKKRSFDSMSADGEDNTSLEGSEGLAPTRATKRTPETEAQDQELVLGVVKGMFNEDGYVEALVESKLEDVTWNTGGLYAEKNGSKGEEIVPYTGEMVPKANVIARKRTPVPMLPPTEPARMSMCYVVKTKVQRGKFFPDKAKALGVDKLDFKKLTAGQNVTGHGGLTVTPEMVLGPTPDPNGFAVVELPDESYIEPFLARPEWKNEDIMRGLRAIYWNLRDNKLLENEKIMNFMEQHNGLRHIILSRTADISPIVLEGAAVETTKLHMIDPDVFPLLPYSDPSVAEKASSFNYRGTKSQYRHARQGEEILLAPKLKYNDDKKLDPIDVRKALSTFASENAEIIQLAEAAKTKVSDPAFLAAIEAADADIPNRDAEIIPLGTGSALPSKTRNVSCTLIRVPGIGNYLLDCGENSLGQLRRMYGYAGADAILKDLKAIWISHSHADHHLGTISILRRYTEVMGPLGPLPTLADGLPTKPLALIAHPMYHNFITEYADIEPFGLDTHIHQLPNASTHTSFGQSNRSARVSFRGRPDIYVPNASHPPQLLAHYGISKLVACKVDHCADSYALALTLSSGLKIAYSGDCRPSRDFAHAEVGGDAHLLIHEATLEDSKIRDAIAKKHSTVSEALRVAKDMKARNVLLTHFSQRYPAMPVLDRESWSTERDVPVLVAFDFMRVRLGDFRRAREFLPALQKMYEAPEDVVGDEEVVGEKGIKGVERKVMAGKRAGP